MHRHHRAAIIVRHAILFSVGFMLRLAPELRSTLPIGLDAGSYIALSKLGVYGRYIPPLRIPEDPTYFPPRHVDVPPLYYWLLQVSWLLQPGFQTFKILNSLIYGFYALSASLSCESLFECLSVVFNPLIYLASLDYYANILGIAMLLLAYRMRRLGRPILLGVCLGLSTLSHDLVVPAALLSAFLTFDLRVSTIAFACSLPYLPVFIVKLGIVKGALPAAMLALLSLKFRGRPVLSGWIFSQLPLLFTGDVYLVYRGAVMVSTPLLLAFSTRLKRLLPIVASGLLLATMMYAYRASPCITPREYTWMSRIQVGPGTVLVAPFQLAGWLRACHPGVPVASYDYPLNLSIEEVYRLARDSGYRPVVVNPPGDG